jgi:hypothetical protein
LSALLANIHRLGLQFALIAQPIHILEMELLPVFPMLGIMLLLPVPSLPL